MNDELEIIKNKVEEKFNTDISSKSRKRTTINAKKAFFYLAEKFTHKSHEKMADYLGFDRTTAIHHLRSSNFCAESIMKFDKEFKKMIDSCEIEIKNELQTKTPSELSTSFRDSNLTHEEFLFFWSAKKPIQNHY